MKKNAILLLLTATFSVAGSDFAISGGGGVLFASDFGGGIEWIQSGQRVRMPNDDMGLYLFLDAVYVEVAAGYSGTVFGGATDSAGNLTGAARWRSAGATHSGDLPDMPRSSFNIGAFVKWPIGSEYVNWFPLAGVEYALSFSSRLKYENGNEYKFDGNAGRPAANALSASWVKFGLGFTLGEAAGFLRGELLYGFRAANAFETDGVEEEQRNGRDARTIRGHGTTLRFGLGQKF